MLHAAEHYELEIEKAPKAAERAVTVTERRRHLETARRYAAFACAERKQSNVYGFRLQAPLNRS
jgi:uncharacterized membrane protein YqiK